MVGSVLVLILLIEEMHKLIVSVKISFDHTFVKCFRKYQKLCKGLCSAYKSYVYR